jgi:hypothetical protein
MLLGQAPAVDGVPCTTCDVYHAMQASGRYLRRDDAARGQRLPIDDAFDIANQRVAQGRHAEAIALCRQILHAAPDHAGARQVLAEIA